MNAMFTVKSLTAVLKNIEQVESKGIEDERTLEDKHRTESARLEQQRKDDEQKITRFAETIGRIQQAVDSELRKAGISVARSDAKRDETAATKP